MGELGATRRYSYWSDRSVKRVADDNVIRLERAWRLGLRSPSAGLMPQAELTEELRGLSRHEMALRIEAAIGQPAVEDFVTPPPSNFAKGVSRVTFAAYTRWNFVDPDERGEKAAILHTRVRASDGSRVEICLFGSIDNRVGRNTEPSAPIWQASSTWAIEEFIMNMGLKPAPIYDDDQSIAVEIVRVLNLEGMTSKYVFTAPASSEWFAQVYKDVVLDKSRWDLRPGSDWPEPVDRIIVGAPLWVRSSSN
jgi:hypothetical protein